MISLRLDGIKGLEAKMKNLTKEMSDGIDKDMQAMVMETNAEQKQLAPVNKQMGAGGTLRSRTQFSKIGALNYELIAATNYAAYQEFGTGGLVNIPAGLEKEAAFHKGKGIRQISMNAQPFFFAPIFKNTIKLIDKIKARFK